MSEEKKDVFELVEVPTQTGIFVRDTQADEVLDDKAVLVRILNEISEIKKILGK